MEADGYYRAIQSISPKFVNNTLAVFAASVARKPLTDQCCAAPQHKSSTVMNEHPRAHTLEPSSLVYLQVPYVKPYQ